MTLVIDQRDAHTGEPGLHVLLVGVSDYPHLSPDNPLAFGMRPLSSTALTAFRIYQWLVAQQEHLPVPLLTCRLLLSPTPDELASEPELAALQVERAELMSFHKAAKAWRSDCATSASNVALFYFAGHGVQRSREDPVMLLQEFGDGMGGALFHAASLKNLYNGMAPTAELSEIARTQFYFVDACRNLPSQFKEFEKMSSSDPFDVSLSGRDDRQAPIFYAALADSRAYALKGEQTVFSKALLHCLSTAAQEPVEAANGTIRWPVTIFSLGESLAHYFRDLDPLALNEQEFALSGTFQDATILLWDEAPPVLVVVQLEPDDALICTSIQIMDWQGQVQGEIRAPLASNPVRLQVPTGIYRLVATVDPPSPSLATRERLEQLKPPRHLVKVKVSS